MKFIPLICFLFLISSECAAQLDQEKLNYASKVSRYRKMKGIGTKLTLTGGVLFIVGISMIFDASSTSSRQTQSSYNSKAETGNLVTLGGEAMLGAGIPLWIVGGHAQRKYERKFERVSFGLNLIPGRKGLSLRYRF